MYNIILPSNFTQEQFDQAVTELKDIVINQHDNCQILLETDSTDKEIVIVDGYMDIDVDFDENGNPFSGSFPHFWYNKQLLNSKNIQYGKLD